MSPQRLFKRWIASEHQHLGSPSPLMPVSHLPVPKCYSAWCLQSSGWRKIRNVMTDFLSPAHSLTVAVEKKKKQETKSAEDAWVQFMLWFSAARNLEPLKSSLRGFGLFFCFLIANLTITYLHKDALTQESVENHRNTEACERPKRGWDQNISWSKACW